MDPGLISRPKVYTLGLIGTLMVKQLPDGKILALSKLKSCADDINATQDISLSHHKQDVSKKHKCLPNVHFFLKKKLPP